MPKISAEYQHAVGAVLDYGFDWAGKGWLRSGETISTSAWVITGMDITLGAVYNVNGITTVFISGAVLGRIYRLTNNITTNAGRADSRTLVVSCVRR
jgi:hypothetical protein